MAAASPSNIAETPLDINAMPEILGIAFAGIAFGLALLAFYLLYQQGRMTNPNEVLLGAIQKFMLLVFCLGVLSIGAQLLSALFAPLTSAEVAKEVARLERENEKIRTELVRIENLSNRQHMLKFGTILEKRMVAEVGTSHNNDCPEGYILIGGRTQEDRDFEASAWQDLRCRALSIETNSD